MKEIELSNSERILQTAIQLMKDRGFKSVTVKDIAQASEVSEMTVYRHFKTKISVLEEAVKKYSFIPSLKKLFDEELVYDLERDLYLVATSYFNLMENNKPIFLIAIQERTTMPELIGIISQNTMQLKSFIIKYFITMQEKKKMVDSDANTQATAFMSMLFGYFTSIALWDNLFISETKEEFLRTSIATFCNGINR